MDLKKKKLINVAVIAAMSVLSPLASSMFTPGIDQIAESLETTSETVVACTTGFVIMLGIKPLFLAPLSETYGRRKLYLVYVMNAVQNYYIDAFEKYAASAIAAGALFCSLFGTVVPLFAPALLDSLDYGWGVSVFGFLAVAISPAPLIFYYIAERIRDSFSINFD
jgi:MFS family permease